MTNRGSFYLQKINPARRVDGAGNAGRRQVPAFLVHLEFGDIAAILVGGEEPVAGGIEADVARGAPTGWHILQAGQLSGLPVNGEDRDTVMAAIADIQMATVVGDNDLG